MVQCNARCRDSILYRLVLAYFTAHDNWASQHNITIMCRVIPHIMRSFPAITRQTQDTFPHLRNAFPRLRIFAFHRASSCSRASSRSIVHLHIPSHIITGASIHCPASSLVRRILFITISDYVCPPCLGSHPSIIYTPSLHLRTLRATFPRFARPSRFAFPTCAFSAFCISSRFTAFHHISSRFLHLHRI